jgi:hypothetical protein
MERTIRRSCVPGFLSLNVLSGYQATRSTILPCDLGLAVVEDHIDFLWQNLLDLRHSIIDNPVGSEGFEVGLIAAAGGGNDGSARMRCQLHRTIRPLPQ